MFKIKLYRQTSGFCGPASLRMVLAYYGVRKTEAEIAMAAGSSRQTGTSPRGLVRSAKLFGLEAFWRKNCRLGDLELFVKKEIPVIVDWFFEDDGHYSVVAEINKKNITLADPATFKFNKIPLEKFYRIWFDFSGSYIKKPQDLILRSVIVVLPKKHGNFFDQNP